MKIELCEDNGFLSDDGKPTLVVLVVTHDNGNKTRIPYEAGKTIANLYEDARRLALKPCFEMNEQINQIEDIVTGVDIQCKNEWHILSAAQYEKKYGAYPRSCPTCKNFYSPKIKEIQNELDKVEEKVIMDHVLKDTIQREDQVKCIRQEKDIDGNVNEEIEVGKIYRVIDIIKKNKRVSYYEVLNDEKNDKIRIAVFPSEIELFKKFVRTTPPRKMTFEMIERCDCGTQVAVLLNGDFYEGVCEVCNNTLKVRRPVKDDKPTN